MTATAELIAKAKRKLAQQQGGSIDPQTLIAKAKRRLQKQNNEPRRIDPNEDTTGAMREFMGELQQRDPEELRAEMNAQYELVSPGQMEGRARKALGIEEPNLVIKTPAAPQDIPDPSSIEGALLRSQTESMDDIWRGDIMGDAAKMREELPENELARSAVTALGSAGLSIQSLMNRIGGYDEYADNLNRFSQAVEMAAAEKDKDSVLGETANRYLRGAINSIAKASLAGPAGGYSVAATFGADSYNQGLTTAKDMGLSEGKAQSYAITQGVLEGGIAMLFQGLGRGGLETLASNPGVLKGTLREAVGRLTKELGYELTEENITNIAQTVADRAYQQNPQEMTWKDWGKLVADTTAQTTLTMGMMGGISRAQVAAMNRSQKFDFARKQLQDMGVESPTRDQVKRQVKSLEAEAKEVKEILDRIEREAAGQTDTQDVWGTQEVEQETPQPPAEPPAPVQEAQPEPVTETQPQPEPTPEPLPPRKADPKTGVVSSEGQPTGKDAALWETDKDIVRAPVSEIKVDPERFQYKKKVDKEGVTQELEGPWDDSVSDSVLLWEDKEGNVFVVNGHHRVALARKEGVSDIRARVLRESDGVSAKDARMRGAHENIKSGRGTTFDAAEYWRMQDEQGLAEAEEDFGGRPTQTQAYRIGRFATDETYDLWRNSQITDGQAAAISTAAPQDRAGQRLAYDYVKKAPDADPGSIKRYLEAGKVLDAQRESGPRQMGLLGDQTEFLDDVENRQKIDRAATEVVSELKARKRTIKNASKVDRSKTAQEYGIEVKSKDDLSELQAAIDSEIAKYERYFEHPDIIEKLKERISGGMTSLFDQEGPKGGEGAEAQGIPKQTQVPPPSDKGTTGRVTQESTPPKSKQPPAPGSEVGGVMETRKNFEGRLQWFRDKGLELQKKFEKQLKAARTPTAKTKQGAYTEGYRKAMREVDDLRKRFYKYVKENLPKDEQGKVLRMMRDMKRLPAKKIDIRKPNELPSELRRLQEGIEYVDRLRSEWEQKAEVKSFHKVLQSAQSRFGKDFKRMRSEYRDAMRGIMENIDLHTLTDRKRKSLEGLRKHLEKHPEEVDRIPDHLLTALERLDKKSVREMETAEIQALTKSMQAIMHFQQMKDSLIHKGRLRKRSEVKNAIVESVGEPKLDEHQKVIQKPDSVFRKASRQVMNIESMTAIAEGKDGGPLQEFVYGSIDEGTTNFLGNKEGIGRNLKGLLAEAGIEEGSIADMSQAFHGKTAAVETVLPSGIRLTLTPGRRIALALTAIDPHGRGGLMNKRGIVVREARKDWRGNWQESKEPTKLRRGFTERDIDALLESLSPVERAMVDIWGKMRDGVLSPMLNKAHEERYGYEIADQPEYFPLRRYSPDRRTPVEEQMARMNYRQNVIEGWSSLKDRIENTTARLEIPDFFNAVTEQIVHIAAFDAFAMPMRNAESILRDPDIQESLAARHGERMPGDLLNMVERVRGHSVDRDLLATTAAKIRARVAASTLGLNPSTWISQTLSYPMALTEIEGKYLAMAARPPQALSKTERQAIEAMASFEVSPQLATRIDKVYMDRDIGDFMNQQETSALWTGQEGTAKDMLVRGLHEFDKFTIKRIMLASWYKAGDTLGKDAPQEARLKEAAAIAEKVVRRTQPTFDMKDRTLLAGTENDLTKSLIPFRSYLDKVLVNGTLQAVKGPAHAAKFAILASIVGPVLNSARKEIYRAIKAGEMPFEDMSITDMMWSMVLDVAGYIPFSGSVLGSIGSAYQYGSYGAWRPISVPGLDVAFDLTVGVGEMGAAATQYLDDDRYKSGKKKGKLKYPVTAKRSLKKLASGLRLAGIPAKSGIDIYKFFDGMLEISGEYLEEDESVDLSERRMGGRPVIKREVAK